MKKEDPANVLRIFLWVGKLPTSRRYNLLPLLRSSPGGFARSWPYRTYPYSLWSFAYANPYGFVLFCKGSEKI